MFFCCWKKTEEKEYKEIIENTKDEEIEEEEKEKNLELFSKGDSVKLQTLLEKYSFSQIVLDKSLVIAVQQNKASCVKILLEKGANPIKGIKVCIYPNILEMLSKHRHAKYCSL